jgi:glutamate-1-semialdehyde 2,1-aminomutase
MPDETARSIANSENAFARARALMPGGVSSPVRAFKAVGGTPLFIREAEGAIITDVDGNEYIDYVMSYGPLIAGHAHENVVAALSKAIGRGTSYGAPTEAEIQLASAITSAVPSIEMVRFVNSGTEAAMSAIRLARAATGRSMVVKCAGCYHGHVDGLLVDAGSGALTLGNPSSPGVPKSVASQTLVVPYNDLSAAREAFAQHGAEIACFAVEPIAGNMGLVLPSDGYLQGLRALCDKHGALLLFDEVMTGFRVALGGAQQRLGVRPDITCLGKVIGGGLPVGAYGASRALMEHISPVGPVYQAGTLSGNPLAMRAGLATLELCNEPGFYDQLEATAQKLADGLRRIAADLNVPMQVNQIGAMVCPFFNDQPVTSYASAIASDAARFGTFFHAMLDEGVYLPPSQYEAWFPSIVHDDAIIDRTVAATGRALRRVLSA